IYNRSGTTIQTVVGAGPGGTDPAAQAAATQLVRYSGWDVFIVTSGNAVTLPSGAEIGDVVEIHGYNSIGSPQIYTIVGETLSNLPISGQNYSAGGLAAEFNFVCFMFRKVSSTNWEPMSLFSNAASPIP